MEKLLKTKPRFIVKRARNQYLKITPAANDLLDKVLRADYQLSIIDYDAFVFERRK